jgi:hypothetical protein
MRRANKLVLVLFVLATTVGLVACGSNDESTETSPAADATATRPSDGPESAGLGGKVPTIVVRDGEPVGGIEELEYDAGDEIRFEVESDVAEEVHVHGYDLMEAVPAGGTVSFDFPAEIEGIFEVELEGLGEQIAELRVNP